MLPWCVTIGLFVFQGLGYSKAQYTPPTQLNCRVELRRRCVLNSQLFGDSLDESRRVWTICRQRSRVASCRLCERTSRQSWPSFQFSASVAYMLQKLGHDSRHNSRTSLKPNTHRRRNSTRQLSCVGVGGVNWA